MLYYDIISSYHTLIKLFFFFVDKITELTKGVLRCKLFERLPKENDEILTKVGWISLQNHDMRLMTFVWQRENGKKGR